MSSDNFQHANDTIVAAEHITKRCVEDGIRVNHRVIYLALLFHDAGFVEDHVPRGFESKEAYSADLATARLRQHGVPTRTIEKVAAAILSTHIDANFVTVEQQAVRAAELSGLGTDYETFWRNTANLKTEHELFYATTLSWSESVGNASRTVRFYLSQEIGLTSYFITKLCEPAFHQVVRGNLERLLDER